MTEETRDFVRELARDLAPVERIARLRVGALRVLGLWLLVTCAAILMKGLTENLADPERMLGGFGAVLFGLSLVGVGGLMAALAASVPGREVTAWLGLGALGVGAAVALGLGSMLMATDHAHAGPPSLHADAMCLSLALVLSVLPAAGALVYVARAAPQRPLPILLGVGAGAAALGGFTAQLGCMDISFRHLIVGHGLAPAIGAVLLIGPLWLGWRRLRR